jgi:hypothetical protein
LVPPGAVTATLDAPASSLREGAVVFFWGVLLFFGWYCWFLVFGCDV